MKARDRKGLFITFEKTAEGLGGTTQSKLLVEALQGAGYDAVYTKNPGGTEVGKVLSDLLKTRRSEEQELSNATELFLWMADRAQQYKEILKPGLSDGKIIVSDRFFDSTLAYQGGGRGFRKPDLLRLHALATGGLLPDLTFIMDGNSHRTVPNDDRYETLGEAFFRRVKKTTLHLLDESPRYVRINANRTFYEVSDEIFTTVDERLLKGWKHAKRTHPST